jgi:hypothetical protein
MWIRMDPQHCFYQPSALFFPYHSSVVTSYENMFVTEVVCEQKLELLKT